MIKHIIHIDQNYPRRFAAQDIAGWGESGVPTVDPSAQQWLFNTTGVDDLNGAIDQQSPESFTQSDVNDSVSAEYVYANGQLTQQQFNQVDAAEQMRFNANVFNYIVHTELSDVILKYEAPVVYALNNWHDSRIVLLANDYDYAIDFDILVHDPIGIDSECYEGWVRGVKFAERKRHKTSNLTEITKDILGAYFTDEHTAIPATTSAELKSKAYRIYSGDVVRDIIGNSSQAVDLAMLFNKQAELYENDDFTYNLHITLAGTGYDKNYINSTDSEYSNWESVINNPDSTETDILTAWEACSGIKYKFYDVAGNVTYWVMPHLELVKMTLDDIAKLQPLILEFIDTNPEDLQLTEDTIGRTTVKVTNRNLELVDFPIIIELSDNSIGRLYPSTYKTSKLNVQGRIYGHVATERVDNIDESGWVIANAYIDVFDFKGALQFVNDMIRNKLKVSGSLGEWIRECKDNLRKISLDPFVSQYLKETTNKKSAYYQLVKFTERYLNTMYKAYDKNCYISVLEMIDRINNFNDPTKIYQNLLAKYDDDHGDMLHISNDELTSLINVDRQTGEDE